MLTSPPCSLTSRSTMLRPSKPRMPANDRAAEAIGFYDRAADEIAVRYDSVSFDEVHPGLRDRLPASPARVLDVGAGSGRDAAAMCAMGHRVTAVEPAAALRALGAELAPGVSWRDDRLPALATLHADRERFDRAGQG